MYQKRFRQIHPSKLSLSLSLSLSQSLQPYQNLRNNQNSSFYGGSWFISSAIVENKGNPEFENKKRQKLCELWKQLVTPRGGRERERLGFCWCFCWTLLGCEHNSFLFCSLWKLRVWRGICFVLQVYDQCLGAYPFLHQGMCGTVRVARLL